MDIHRKRNVKKGQTWVDFDHAELVEVTELGSIWSTVKVDSPAFQAWVKRASGFTYGRSKNSASYTARKEAKARGAGDYWYAYKKDDAGRLHKVYIGKSEELTAARLYDVMYLMIAKLDPVPFNIERAEKIKAGESYGARQLEKFNSITKRVIASSASSAAELDQQLDPELDQ